MTKGIAAKAVPTFESEIVGGLQPRTYSATPAARANGRDPTKSQNYSPTVSATA